MRHRMLPAVRGTTCVLMLLGFYGGTRADDSLFPFVVSYETHDNATNIASWLDRPAGRQGFIRAEEATFANDAGPIRFWGTNLCFDACFPTHEQAESLARRLARFGINVVRMHHMDARSIWGDSPNRLTIDPQRLERLDYLIFCLKREGVYANLNLHVSRKLGPAEGFPDPEKRPNYDKGLDNFEPRMIELQKQYARDLLTHVNPYTGQPYSHEPAVAFVEINNENALFHEWARGALDELPEPYATTFRQRWNAWLREKYGNSQAVREAWRQGEQPLGGELLANGDFTRPLAGSWNMERDGAEQATWSIEPHGLDDKPLLRIVVNRPGSVSWRPQLSLGGFAVRQGRAYTLTFAVRAPQPRSLSVNCRMNHEPWGDLGLHGDLRADGDWRRYRFTFLAARDDDRARITFTNLQPGVYELAQVSLRPGGVAGLAAEELLENDGIAVLPQRNQHRTETARRDFLDFLWDTESAYWGAMYRYLKEDLGVKALVAGTQLLWSPVHVQARLDYLDAHAYWQHPHFPGRPWDPRNWYVNNVAMVNSPGGELADLANRRVAQKPFVVSEYNHPTPNAYAAEGLPMLAAMAAFQNWNGAYSFAWSHADRFDPQRLTGYFDIQGEPTRLVHLPASAAMFLRGDVAPAKTVSAIPLPFPVERRQLHATGTAWSLAGERLGANSLLALVQGVALDLAENDRPAASAPPPISPDAKVFVADQGAIRWDVSRPGKGFIVVDTPRTKFFTGFVDGRSFSIGNVRLDIGPTRNDWATVSLTCLDGEGFDRPGRMLIAATGWRQNADWGWEELGENRVTLRDRWGREPVLCEGVPLVITLPLAADRAACYALDAAGNRTRLCAVSAKDGQTQLALGPEYKTLWYEVLVP